ncbi:hypothetical protein BN1708_002516, partial [Verticillium longisporum]
MSVFSLCKAPYKSLPQSAARGDRLGCGRLLCGRLRCASAWTVGVEVKSNKPDVALQEDRQISAQLQAVDRVHRIGQQNEVKVYRILVKDSVEDRIMEIQTRKREAIDAALDGKASKGMGLSMADLRHLFGF